MKSLFCFSVLVLFCSMSLKSQHIYTLSGGEAIFQSSSVEQNNSSVNTNVRFTLFFHAGEYVHIDLGNNIGLFSGIGLRNVGFITEENHVKIKYRSYSMGVPLALKLGSFKKNIYVFGGAEYEWMIHFKQKVFENNEKVKYSKWFSDRTPDFIPSAFAGFQFPGGIQVKFKYYLDNFLNHDYNGGQPYNNYTSFNKSQVWYISLTFMIRNTRIKNVSSQPTEIAEL
jgi:hypothetical protein